jgi:antitoxin MazE
MRSTIGKWGHSLALRRPRRVAEEARLIEGAKVNIEVEDGAMKVTPSRRRLTLPELLQGEYAIYL